MIVAAAIRAPDERVFSLPKPARHSDVVRSFRDEIPVVFTPGFLDDSGRFLGRMQAAAHAVACSQVRIDAINLNLGLFTEDLW